MAHFVIGTVLAITYATTLFVTRLPSPGVVRGALYGLVPWIVAQLMVMPMMGAGLFGGSFGAAFGSLMGHLVYGAVLGGIYGTMRTTCGDPTCSRARMMVGLVLAHDGAPSGVRIRRRSAAAAAWFSRPFARADSVISRYGTLAMSW